MSQNLKDKVEEKIGQGYSLQSETDKIANLNREGKGASTKVLIVLFFLTTPIGAFIYWYLCIDKKENLTLTEKDGKINEMSSNASGKRAMHLLGVVVAIWIIALLIPENPEAKALRLEKEKIEQIEQARLDKLSDSEKAVAKAKKDSIERIQKATENEAKSKEERDAKWKEGFSSWNGSHRQLEKYIKEHMNDEDSYEHVQTLAYDNGSYYAVTTVFKGKNKFGAIVKQTVTAKVAIDGSIIEIVSSD